MKKIIVAVTAIVLSGVVVAQDTVTVTPVMNGAYGGHTCAADGSYYEWPSSAEVWGGCANTAEIYPLDFPNGGTLTMTASATAGDCDVGFTAEATAGGGAAYSNASSVVTVTGSEPAEYVLVFDNEEDGKFESLIMSVKTRDCGVNISAMTLEHGPVALSEEEAACADTSVIRFEDAFGAKDGNDPDVTCLTDTYVVPAGAESWAGFGDTARGDYYPFEFPYGGTLTFEGSATTTTNVEFLFQTAAFPNNIPEQGVIVEVAAGGAEGRTAYSVDIPASANSYGNLVFYVGTAGNPSYDNPVTIRNIAITPAAAPPPPPPAPAAPATPVPALPLWGLLGLVGLIGLFGFRRRR
jgi:hypothetical protein